MGLLVRACKQGGAAALRKYDEILFVNGTDFSDLDQDDAIRVISVCCNANTCYVPTCC